jgi:methionyl-tRNA formyltransferase
MNSPLRVIFLGTPDFAVTPLKALVDSGVHIVAVVTAPDKPAGRGMQLQESPIKKFAVSHHIPVLQPTKLKAPEFIDELKSYHADLQVVIAFRMLPEIVWNMPRLSTFLLKHEIDTGDLIHQQEVAILPEMTVGELHDMLMKVGADLIVKTVAAVENGNYTPTPQKEPNGKFAPKIFTEHCLINWAQKGAQVFNHVRGLSPYPGAFTKINEQILKIYHCTFESSQHQEKSGTIQTNSGKNPYIRFAVNDGWIYAIDVQLQGKKRMKAEDLLRGWRY